MQAVSGNACSCVSTGGCCACSASAFCNKYPVARESQKFPPKNRPTVALYWRTGYQGEYVYRGAVRLPALNAKDPGYAIIVRLTDGIGPLKPTYGMWQKPQALFLKGDIFLSKFMTLPSRTFALCPVWANIGGCPVSVGGGNARNCARASLSMKSTSRKTRAIS